jgi:GntR family transcriptional regulator
LDNNERIRTDSRPLYLIAHERLLARIEEGFFKPDDRLPSEPVLAEELGISRSTLREALRIFEEEGLISRKPGVGTFIIRDNGPVMETGLETLESLETMAHRLGMVAGTTGLRISRVKASREYAEKLGVNPGDSLIYLSRVKTAQDRRVAFMYDLLPERYVDLDDLRSHFQGSVIDYLIETGVPIAYARSDIVPTNASPSLAQKLRIKPRTPILLVEETLFLKDGSRGGYSLNYFVREFFRFHVISRPPSAGSKKEG